MFTCIDVRVILQNVYLVLFLILANVAQTVYVLDWTVSPVGILAFLDYLPKVVTMDYVQGITYAH